MKIISATFIILGTYLLSKSIFISSVKMLSNIKYKDLPWYFKLVIISLYLKKNYVSSELWMMKREDYAPTKDNFSWAQKSILLQPYIGFIFISIGTFLSIVP